jgi:hypothetical protein
MTKNSKSRDSGYWTTFDLVVYLLILMLGALEFAMSRRAADYLNDTNYFELFNSILHHAGYGFNHKPMTQLPPGFPYFLAWISVLVGSSYTAMIRVMTVFTTLGLIASYELLRFQQDRNVAAMACLLLGSAPLLFEFSTSMVFADMPYFFTSLILLYLAIRLDTVHEWRLKHAVAWLLWGILLVGTVLLKSMGISLLGGLFCWMAVGYFTNPEAGKRRLKRFLPMVILASAAQVGWMAWAARNQFHEWSIPGYQENYVAQLRLKNANVPELGMATLRDVIIRPIQGADDIAASMLGLFAHKQMAAAWYSPGTLLPLILVLLGLRYSFRQNGGGLLEWYFVCYETMFLFWPWEFELRFFLPVAPLAFLYAWRGGHAIWRITRIRPSLVGTFGLTLALLGCLGSLVWGRGVLRPQLRWCVAGWLLVAVFSIALFTWRTRWMQRLVLLFQHLLRIPIKERSAPLWQYLTVVVVFCVFSTGVAAQWKIGLVNLDTNLARDDFNYPDIEAAEWIKANSTPASVVMARKDDIIYHYSQRRVIWFPPSRDAAVLMTGIRHYHVQYVVVHYGNDAYWRPAAQECFDALSRAYPGSFRLAHAGPHNKVFEVAVNVRANPS